MRPIPEQPEASASLLDATGAVDDLGALAVAVTALTDGAGSLSPDQTRAVYVLSSMAVEKWRQLDALIEASVVRDVRQRA